MKLSLDQISLAAPEPSAAVDFYTAVLGAAPDNNLLSMQGAGRFEIRETDSLVADSGAAGSGVAAPSAGFRGFVLSYIVDQPSEIEAVLAAAVAHGATVLKPAKKAMFAGFSAVFQAPDGAIWKLASAKKRDTGAAAAVPIPSETAALLGVADPKASKAFYSVLGMTVDRDYGNKYIDFQPTPGRSRFGLMQRPALAKDAGVSEDGSGFRAIVLTCRVGSKEEVDTLLTTVESVGGRIARAAGGVEASNYAGHFVDPDGFHWKVIAP